jgi:hypothetical protein
LSCGSYECNLVSNNLGCISLLTVVVGPGSCLELTADENGIALFEIAADKFSLLSPRNDVNEVYSLLTLVSLSKTTINSDREGANRRACSSLLKLGIGCHVTNKDNFIETCHFSASYSEN